MGYTQKMNTKKNFKSKLSRIALLAMAFVMTLTLLVGCGGGKQKASLTINDDTFLVGAEDLDKLVMSPQNLKLIAKMLSSVYSETLDSRELLVAAYRGYDMTAEGFDDSNLPAPAEDKLATVKKILIYCNEKAEADAKVDVALFDQLNDENVKLLIKSLQTTVDTTSSNGIFDPLLRGIGAVLRWLTNTLCFGNYLVGICLFAVIIEILMLPFAIKQQKNSIKQAKLRPKEMAIRNKYKGRNDQVTMQKMQQEIQEFYQRENFSPYSGCMPLLIQLPIIMALYSIIIDPLHYVLGQASGISGALTSYFTAARAAGGMGMTLGGNGSTIVILSNLKENLAALDGLKDFLYFSNGQAIFDSLSSVVNKIPNFNIGSVNFGLTPNFERFDILLLVPVVTFATYFATSKLNRKFMYQPATNEGADARQVACSNTMMDITMPAMSTVFTFMVPALVGIYWVFRSIVGLGKQFLISKAMPLPTFTEEDYKAAAREMSGKRATKKTETVKAVRSLHYIDDEDYEDTRERGLARKAAIEERERQEQKKKAERSPFGVSPMKGERKDAQKDEEASSDESNQEENDN